MISEKCILTEKSRGLNTGEKKPELGKSQKGPGSRGKHKRGSAGIGPGRKKAFVGWGKTCHLKIRFQGEKN